MDYKKIKSPEINYENKVGKWYHGHFHIKPDGAGMPEKITVDVSMNLVEPDEKPKKKKKSKKNDDPIDVSVAPSEVEPFEDDTDLDFEPLK